MTCDNLNAYESLSDLSERISSTKISKVSYLLKLQAQSNSISNLDLKHKQWARKFFTSNISDI